MQWIGWAILAAVLLIGYLIWNARRKWKVIHIYTGSQSELAELHYSLLKGQSVRCKLQINQMGGQSAGFVQQTNNHNVNYSLKVHKGDYEKAENIIRHHNEQHKFVQPV